VTHSLRHVVPYVTHELRTVHEMRDTQCHACALNNFVVTNRHTLPLSHRATANATLLRHDFAKKTIRHKNLAESRGTVAAKSHRGGVTVVIAALPTRGRSAVTTSNRLPIPLPAEIDVE